MRYMRTIAILSLIVLWPEESWSQRGRGGGGHAAPRGPAGGARPAGGNQGFRGTPSLSGAPAQRAYRPTPGAETEADNVPPEATQFFDAARAAFKTQEYAKAFSE